MPRTTAIDHVAGDAREKAQFAVAFNIVLAGRLWRTRFADRMRNVGATDARWNALTMIANLTGIVTQARLAESLGVQAPTLVKLLDGLEKQGLISRRASPSDRRVNVIAIEPKGRETLKVVDGFAAKMRTELFEGVSNDDLDATLGVLSHLLTQLEPEPVAI